MKLIQNSKIKSLFRSIRVSFARRALAGVKRKESVVIEFMGWSEIEISKIQMTNKQMNVKLFNI